MWSENFSLFKFYCIVWYEAGNDSHKYDVEEDVGITKDDDLVSILSQ